MTPTQRGIIYPVTDFFIIYSQIEIKYQCLAKNVFNKRNINLNIIEKANIDIQLESLNLAFEIYSEISFDQIFFITKRKIRQNKENSKKKFKPGQKSKDKRKLNFDVVSMYYAMLAWF